MQVIRDAQQAGMPQFDLAVCDEAHRTTGYSLKDEERSNFLMIHDAEAIRAPQAFVQPEGEGQGREGRRIPIRQCDQRNIRRLPQRRCSVLRLREYGVLRDVETVAKRIESAVRSC